MSPMISETFSLKMDFCCNYYSARLVIENKRGIQVLRRARHLHAARHGTQVTSDREICLC